MHCGTTEKKAVQTLVAILCNCGVLNVIVLSCQLYLCFWFTFKHLSMMANADPRAEFDKRWPQTKVSFSTEHHWTVGQFPIVDKSTGEASKEKILSPKFKVDGHDLQFQMTLQFWGKKAENEKEVVNFGLHCYQGKEVASEVPVVFTLRFYDGSTLPGVIYGIN